MTLVPAIADVVAADKLNAPSHADLHQDVKANIQRLLDGLPAIFQVALSGGPTSGATVLSLGNVVVPALDVATIQYPSMFWTGRVDADGADAPWQANVRDDSTAGTIRGSQTQQQPAETSGNLRLGFSIAHALGRATPVTTARTYHFCVQRSGGAGTITDNGNVSYGSVLVLPNLS